MNIFEGKDDQVLMYVTDRSTGEIKETKLVKASSKSAQTRWSNNFVNDDTTGSPSDVFAWVKTLTELLHTYAEINAKENPQD